MSYIPKTLFRNSPAHDNIDDIVKTKRVVANKFGREEWVLLLFNITGRPRFLLRGDRKQRKARENF